jgi:FixJ family two-component response regulator
VIDDDVLMRIRFKELFESVRLRVLLFEWPAAFLQSKIAASTSCMVLDVRLPGMSGIKLQEELSKQQIQVPIVFVSGSTDAATAVRAMKAGAVDFLSKPVLDQEVLDAVFASIERDRERRRKEASLAGLRNGFTSLSTRERQVLLGVVGGKRNKQVAAELGVSEVMVKVHRANGMRKMHVTSLAELVRVIDQLSGTAEPAYPPVRHSKSVAGVRNTPSQAGIGPESRRPGHDPPIGRDPDTRIRTKR